MKVRNIISSICNKNITRNENQYFNYDIHILLNAKSASLLANRKHIRIFVVPNYQLNENTIRYTRQ